MFVRIRISMEYNGVTLLLDKLTQLLQGLAEFPAQTVHWRKEFGVISQVTGVGMMPS